jgi:uncharacterized membrane protein
MTKNEFMNELEQLLSDISSEERSEALKYYSDYFEDAGPDREQAIVSELGTPARVAASIKADLIAGEQEVKNRGYFTEKGYEDESFNEPKYEIVNGEEVKDDKDNPKEAQNKEDNTNSQYYGHVNDSQSEDYGYTNTQNRQYDRAYNNTEAGGYHDSSKEEQYGRGNNNGLRVFLIILLCIFAIPVGIPIISVVFSLFLAAAITVGALWLTFVIVSAVLIIVGIGVTAYGIFKLIAFPALGFCYTGGGLIVFGIGLVFAMITILLSSKVMPVIIRGFINFCRLPFHNRRVPA